MLNALNEQVWDARDMDELNRLRGERRAAIKILRVPEEMKEMLEKLKGDSEDV